MRTYIHNPLIAKKIRTNPDASERATPTGPKVSPEWRWWSRPRFQPPGAGLGRQFMVSGQANPAGAATFGAASRAASLAMLPTWLSTPVTAIQSMNTPKKTDSQRCHLRMKLSLLRNVRNVWSC